MMAGVPQADALDHWDGCHRVCAMGDEELIHLTSEGVVDATRVLLAFNLTHAFGLGLSRRGSVHTQ